MTVLYRAIAEVVAANTTAPIYLVSGEANLLWAAVASEELGMRVVHTRHEAGAVAMADGYARISGEVGLCSTAQGPGLTNATTAIAVAAAHGTALVVLTGEPPLVSVSDSSCQLYQRCDQESLVCSVGARYMRLTDPQQGRSLLAHAFHTAREARVPVVVGIPVDLLLEEVRAVTADTGLEVSPPSSSTPSLVSTSNYTDTDRETAMDACVDRILAAARPAFICGRGVTDEQAVEDLRVVALALGAPLSTTVRGKGLFDGHPLDVGIAGGYASPVAREAFAVADCLIVIGSSLRAHTLHFGAFAPHASVNHIDVVPAQEGVYFGTADHFVPADAAVFASRLRQRLEERPAPGTNADRTEALMAERAQELTNLQTICGSPGVSVVDVDPHDAARALQASLPIDARITIGIGHFWWFPLMHLRGRSRDRYLFSYDFGCVGEGLGVGLGAAHADPAARTVVVEGDVSLMMAMADLETAVRTGANLLIVVWNDGAAAAETHRIGPLGWKLDGFVEWPRTDLAAVMSGLGGLATNATNPQEITDFVSAWVAVGGAALLNIAIDRHVVSPHMSNWARSMPEAARKLPSLTL